MRTLWRHFLHRFLGTLLGWGLFAGGCVVWGLTVIPVTLLLRPFWSGAEPWFRSVTHAWLGLYSRTLLFARFSVEGDFSGAPRPCVLVANHQSWLDPVVLIGHEPNLRGPAQAYLFRAPFLGAILRLSGFYPSNGADALERAAEAAAQARRDGGCILFFPEGTRTHDGEVAAFHRGGFRAAFDADLPIQPVVIDGLDRVLPRQGWIAPRPVREHVRIRYLQPVHPPYGEGPRREVVRALCSQVREAMVEELAEMRAGAAPG